MAKTTVFSKKYRSFAHSSYFIIYNMEIRRLRPLDYSHVFVSFHPSFLARYFGVSTMTATLRHSLKTLRFCLLLISAFVALSFSSVLACNQDIWLVDTHPASWTRATPNEFAKIRYFRLTPQGWVRSDAATFFETQIPDLPLIVYSPGYTSTFSDTVRIGGQLVSLFDAGRPCRVVFWHWPSERVRRGIAKDIRAKIPVGNANGAYMAMFLQNLQPQSQVGIVAFSFGNRIVCDAVERIGVTGHADLRIRMVLAASATDYYAFAENGSHGNVPKTAERMLILYNPRDRALKFYPLLYGCGSGVDALGRYGPPARAIQSEYRRRIEAVNVQTSVGPRHRTVSHIGTPAFRSRIGTYLFFDD